MYVFPEDCIAAKNLDLIACTPARYRRFSRKCSWAASKETRASSCGIGVFATSFVLGSDLEFKRPGKASVFASLHYYISAIK